MCIIVVFHTEKSERIWLGSSRKLSEQTQSHRSALLPEAKVEEKKLGGKTSGQKIPVHRK